MPACPPPMTMASTRMRSSLRAAGDPRLARLTAAVSSCEPAASPPRCELDVRRLVAPLVGGETLPPHPPSRASLQVSGAVAVGVARRARRYGAPGWLAAQRAPAAARRDRGRPGDPEPL